MNGYFQPLFVEIDDKHYRISDIRSFYLDGNNKDLLINIQHTPEKSYTVRILRGIKADLVYEFLKGYSVNPTRVEKVK